MIEPPMIQPYVLPVLALQNESLILAIAEGDVEKVADLARRLGRDKSNLHKSIKALTEAGLVTQSEVGLIFTAAGCEARDCLVRMRDRRLPPSGTATPASTSSAHRIYRFADLDRDDCNPREGRPDSVVRGLLASIVAAGRILEPISTRQPAEGGARDRVTFGQTRWLAVGLGISEGVLPEDFPIPAVFLERTDAQVRRETAAENDARADLNHMERARQYEGLAALDGLSNAEIAALCARSAEYVQQHRRLLKLSVADQALVASGDLPLHAALDQLRIRQQKPKAASAPPAGPAWAPTPRHTALLAEIDHRISNHPADGSNTATLVHRNAQRDAQLIKLADEGYVGWSEQLADTRLWLRPKAYEHFSATFEEAVLANADALLAAARHLLGLATHVREELEAARRYDADWLNHGLPSPALAPTAVADPTDVPKAAPKLVEGPLIPADGADPADLAPGREQLLQMVEVAHAVIHRPSAAYPGWTEVTADVFADRAWTQLIRQAYVTVVRGPSGCAARLMPAGVEDLARRRLDPEANHQAVLRVRELVDLDDAEIWRLEEQGAYATPWLNLPATGSRAG